MRFARLVLVVAGCASAAFGALAAVQSLAIEQLVWLVVWLGGCIVVHDAVLAPLLSVARRRLRRAGRAWPPGVTALVEAGFMLVGAIALFVAPELVAQGRRNPNPTILQADYGMRLLVTVALVTLVVLVAVRVLIRRARS